MTEMQLSGDQRRTCGSWFLLSTTWGPGITVLVKGKHPCPSTTSTSWVLLHSEHPYPLTTPTAWAPIPLTTPTPWSPHLQRTPTPWAPLPAEPSCWPEKTYFKENRLNLFPLNKKNLRTEKQSGLALYKNNSLSKPSGKGIYLEFLSPRGLLFTFSPLPQYLE